MVDPMNLIWVMPAQGNGFALEKATPPCGVAFFVAPYLKSPLPSSNAVRATFYLDNRGRCPTP
jgi:hypothetical protein